MTVRRRRLAITAGIAMALLAVVLANAHLVYVALDSQPECIAHVRAGEAKGAFGAARPSC